MTSSVFVPHDYQKRAIEWGLSHSHCGLFLPMGAGKTVITLTILSELIGTDVGEVLIIGPKRVIECTWPAEIEKWSHTGWINYAVIDAPTAKGKKEWPQADLYLVGRDNVVDLLAHHKSFDMIIVDELSSFKNPRSRRFRALSRLRPGRFIGLTGTPAPNGIPDLWAQIFLMDYGERLGKTLGAFREQFLIPGRRSGYVVYDWLVKPGADQDIKKRLSDLCMSLERYDLPPITYHNDVVRFPENLLSEYRRFSKKLVFTTDVTAANAGVLAGKLSQFTSGEIYTDAGGVKTIHDIKIDALLRLIEQAGEEPVMVFYWFKHELERIKKAIPEAVHLQSAKDINDWNAGKIPVLLVHPASAGHGLNLQHGGHIGIWYSLPAWNLELYEQAVARIYRQGVDGGVWMAHILIADTIDIRQIKALQSKKATQGALIAALRKESDEAFRST